jgi:hypothetical protein
MQKLLMLKATLAHLTIFVQSVFTIFIYLWLRCRFYSVPLTALPVAVAIWSGARALQCSFLLDWNNFLASLFELNE